MKRNRGRWLVPLVWAVAGMLRAQDAVVPPLKGELPPTASAEAPLPGTLRRFVPVDSLFFHQGKNFCGESRIEREERLFPLFGKLCGGSSPVRIVHIGDSHVRGHVFPVAARRALEAALGHEAVFPDSITYHTPAIARETGLPGLVYHAIGINGATTTHFAGEERLHEIAALRPDLIILSFGTNEAHARRYDAAVHRTEMEALLTLLRHHCPQAIVMLTTPPGSFLRQRGGRRIPNPHTPTVVMEQLRFAADHALPLWNLYELAGGKARACANWRKGRYMQRDQVHFTHEGYRLQGLLLAEALLHAYNRYVAD